MWTNICIREHGWCREGDARGRAWVRAKIEWILGEGSRWAGPVRTGWRRRVHVGAGRWAVAEAGSCAWLADSDSDSYSGALLSCYSVALYARLSIVHERSSRKNRKLY